MMRNDMSGTTLNRQSYRRRIKNESPTWRWTNRTARDLHKRIFPQWSSIINKLCYGNFQNDKYTNLTEPCQTPSITYGPGLKHPRDIIAVRWLFLHWLYSMTKTCNSPPCPTLVTLQTYLSSLLTYVLAAFMTLSGANNYGPKCTWSLFDLWSYLRSIADEPASTVIFL